MMVVGVGAPEAPPVLPVPTGPLNPENESINFSKLGLRSLSIDDKISALRRLHEFAREATWEYKLGIVTAVTIERAAVEAVFGELETFPAPNDPNSYAIATVPSHVSPGDSRVVVSLLNKMGTNSAASAVVNLFRSFPDLRYVLMVGIAGGMPHPEKPDSHVRLGDLVVSDEKGIVQFDFRRQLAGGAIELRASAMSPSARLLGVVKVLEAGRLQGRKPWEELIGAAYERLPGVSPPSPETDILHDDENKQTVMHPEDSDRVTGSPKIHLGRIGSANILLEDARERDRLRKELNLRAVEMESAGIADGAWNHGREFIVVRGVCDYCDSHRNDDPKAKEQWQARAAIVAAAYARVIIEQLPVPLI